MNETTKESKFLDAITRYSEKQRALITREVEEYKTQKIEQATESGLKDAYELIQREIAERKAAIVTEYSQKQQALRRELFALRAEIADAVFRRAEEEIIEYTSTPGYKAYVLREAGKASELIGGAECNVRLREADKALSDDIIKLLPGGVFVTDDSILIGGVIIDCAEKGLRLDCTLDTRLSDQRRWFAENSGLKVV